MGLFNLFSKKDKKIADFINRGAIILDVRTTEEFSKGAIDGSINIALHEIPTRITEIKQLDKPIVACCVMGSRSAKAVSILQKNGIEAVNGGGWISLSKKL